MFGQLYLLVITVLLLAALAAAVPVLRDIVRDGRERQRKWQSGEMERYAEDEDFDAKSPAPLDDESESAVRGTVDCPRCGEENSTEFTYCYHCTERL